MVLRVPRGSEVLNISVYKLPNSTRAMRSRLTCWPFVLLRLRPKRCRTCPLVSGFVYADSSMRIRFGFTPRILNSLFLMLNLRRRSLKIGRVGRVEGHNRLHPCHSEIVQLVRVDRALSIDRCKKSLPWLAMHTTILRGSLPPPKGAVAVNFPEILMTSSIPGKYG